MSWNWANRPSLPAPFAHNVHYFNCSIPKQLLEKKLLLLDTIFKEEPTSGWHLSNLTKIKTFFSQIGFFCMLIKGSSRICLNHVAECFQDDSQIQDPILQHLKCLLCFILIWYVLSAFCIHTTVLRMLQSVTESLSLIQNKSLPFYLTLWDCLTCHYTHIYPIWPMNLSTYLSISRQKNPICEKKILILVKLDRCQPEVGSSLLIVSFTGLSTINSSFWY